MIDTTALQGYEALGLGQRGRDTVGERGKANSVGRAREEIEHVL